MKNTTTRTNTGFETQGVVVGTKLIFETQNVVVGNSRCYCKNQPKMGQNYNKTNLQNKKTK